MYIHSPIRYNQVLRDPQQPRRHKQPVDLAVAPQQPRCRTHKNLIAVSMGYNNLTVDVLWVRQQGCCGCGTAARLLLRRRYLVRRAGEVVVDQVRRRANGRL
jgi:hypothetical protein